MVTPVMNSGVSVRFMMNSERMVAMMEVMLETILVVSAEVLMVHINCASTSRLAERQNTASINQKSQSASLGLAAKSAKEPLHKHTIPVIGMMMNDC